MPRKEMTKQNTRKGKTIATGRRKVNKWSKAEDNLMRELVKKHGLRKWSGEFWACRIQEQFHGRASVLFQGTRVTCAQPKKASLPPSYPLAPSSLAL